MLQVNTVFSLSGGQYRVLWSNSETTILIDLDGSGAFPEKRDTEELERLFAEGAATVVDDPFLAQTMAFADEDSKSISSSGTWLAIDPGYCRYTGNIRQSRTWCSGQEGARSAPNNQTNDLSSSKTLLAAWHDDQRVAS